ncbi:hypothetical protein B0H11DRAFT_2267607 [Mycena galericulata]|nr:hypothetical protein B0H11DRAFT_2267607 [Mycena galericulata]
MQGGFYNPVLVFIEMPPLPLDLPELLASILEQVCGCSLSDFKAFCRRRETISLVCHKWANCVNQNPLLWKYLVVYYELESSVLRTWLERAHQALVDVFVRYQGSGPKWHLLTLPACEKSASIVGVLASKASQLQTLQIYAEDIACARVFTDCIATVSFPELRSLAVCAWMPLSQLPFAVSHHSLPRMLDGHLPVLRDLTLFSAHISVSQAQRLENLQYLRLGGMANHCSYSWEVLLSIFQTATTLSKLSLSSVECTDMPLLAASRRLLMPALEELDLAFLGRPEVARLVASFRMPSLKTLRLTCDTSRDVSNAVTCLSEDDIFSEVEVLIIAGIGTGSALDIDDDLSRLYRSMRKIRVLDLTDAHPLFFTSLIMEDREECLAEKVPTSMPQLARVDLPAVPSVCLRAFVMMRSASPQCALRELYFDKGRVELCSEGNYDEC